MDIPKHKIFKILGIPCDYGCSECSCPPLLQKTLGLLGDDRFMAPLVTEPDQKLTMSSSFLFWDRATDEIKRIDLTSAEGQQKIALMKKHEYRMLGWDHVEGVLISTLFMLFDQSFSLEDSGDRQLFLFQTHVWGKEASDPVFINKYISPAEARAGHKSIVDAIALWRKRKKKGGGLLFDFLKEVL